MFSVNTYSCQLCQQRPLPRTSMNIRDIVKGKVVIVGIGNTLRGDDGFGPMLIEQLQELIPAMCLDAGSAPENYTGKIIKAEPDTIILVDAVHLGKKPGDFEIIQKSDIAKCGFSTHDMSPNMFIEYLENQTNAQIHLIGVQPHSIAFGDEMSEPVTNAMNELVRLIKQAFDTQAN